MKRRGAFILAVLVALAIGSQAQEKGPLKLVETIPLPGLKDGDFDHFTPVSYTHLTLPTICSV